MRPAQAPGRQIVSATSNRRAARDAIEADVHFQIAGNTRLRLRRSDNDAQLLAHLGQQIKHRPTDLRAHMQRIDLLNRLSDQRQLYGAMIDLFIALGSAGRALKQRCLAQSGTVLNEAQKKLLNRAIDRGLKATEPLLARVHHSVLSLGFTGRHTIIKRHQSTPDRYQNAYDEAMSCLEYGQLEEARRVLEDAVRQGYDDPRLSDQLREIYERTQDHDALLAMRDWLRRRHGVLPDGW